MKRLLKSFLFLILLSTNLYSQTADPFFFGMYSWQSGIHYTDQYTIYHDKAGNQDFMTFWKNNLQMNSQIVNIYPNWLAAIMRDNPVYPYKYDAFLKYFKGKDPGNGVVSTYGINGDIEGKRFFPIFEDQYISVLSEAHYLKLNPTTTETDMIVGTTPFTYDAVNMKVINNYSSPRAGTLIGNISVQGSNTGLSIIIPRISNISANEARFKIRFKITADAPATLNVKILNNPANPLYGAISSSLHNYQPLNSNIYVTQAANQVFELSFYLDKNETFNNYSTAYNFALQLLVTGTLAANKSVQFNEIAIYDDLGRQIVENGNFDHFPDLTIDLNSFTDELVQTSGIPIVRLADEPVIGNFAPSKAVKDYMRTRAQNSGKSLYFYGVQPERSSFWDSYPESVKLAAKNIVKRFYTVVGVDYTGFDNYPFGIDENGVPDDTINIPPKADYVWNIYGEYYTSLKNYKKSIRENNLGFKNLIAIPQIFSETGKWRNPTKSEIISNSYISMLLGYKGIIYFYSGLSDVDGWHGIYKSGAQMNANLGQYVQGITDPTKVYLNKVAAVKKVGSFLNETVDIDNPAQKVGDLLAAASPNINEENNRILGRNANNVYDCLGTYTINLGDETNFTLLEKVDIINPSTGAINTSKNLVGVNWFAYNGKSYFMFANLNEDGHAFRLKLYFKSHKARLLKVNTAPYSVFGKITYPASGTVFLDIPQDGAVLMQIENTNAGWHGFPRNETRFGIARTTNNLTSLYLDNNFYTKSGVAEEVSINTGINAANVFPLYVKTTTPGKRYTDIVTYRVTGNTTSTKTVEYRIYRQDPAGLFATIPTIYTKTINVPSTVTLQPIAYDGNKDGNDELGYVLIYNNHFYIYTYSNFTDALPLNNTYRIKYPKEETVSNPPLYYNPATAAVFGMNTYDEVGDVWTSSLGIYNVDHFYMDMNADNDIISSETFPMWSANHIPIVGDWSNNDMYHKFTNEAYEYGLYGWDALYGNSFKLNFGHNDGYGYFNFPYGDPGDKPIVWIPRVVSTSKSESEAAEEEVVSEIPSEYSLSQNYPNPFNPATTIRFALPSESRVTLEVYNILGERVTELLNEVRQAGTMEVQFNGANMPSGVYIYRFRAVSLEDGKHFEKINKMMLLK